MNIGEKETLLYFNFADSDEKTKPLLFTKPRKIIVARTINEVLPCLEIIQHAVNNGYYAAGYLSYEAAPAFNKDYRVNPGSKLPLLWFGIFNNATAKQMNSSHPFHTTPWKPTVPIDTYNRNINKIHSYIKQGKTKQVNYTIPFESEFNGNSIAFYKQLEHAQSSSYSAYMDTGDYTILSASPELFFRVKNGKVTTKPMKGTVDRGKTSDEDIKNANWLQTSEKNRMENKLIQDLMRGELNKIAIPGTVNVPSKYEIEKYPTVFQMTSTITANIAPEKDIMDIFKAIFPCGSITGMPKKETMDIITELESEPREVYCGAIGYMTPYKEAVFNVPIRTVLIDNLTGKAQYGAGGAITIDSSKEEEYAEILTKAKLLTEKPQQFQLLESLGLFNGTYLILENHLNRLERSANYFNFDIDMDSITNALNVIACENKQKQWKVRLLVAKSREFSIEISEIPPLPNNAVVAISEKPVQKDDLFLYHKTTNRNVYEEHQKMQSKEVFDVLLWNEDEEVTEFTMGNIVIELAGKLVTPPIESGLLAGTYRLALLQDDIIMERKIKLDELKKCEGIWFINSVRKWVPVQLK